MWCRTLCSICHMSLLSKWWRWYFIVCENRTREERLYALNAPRKWNTQMQQLITRTCCARESCIPMHFLDTGVELCSYFNVHMGAPSSVISQWEDERLTSDIEQGFFFLQKMPPCPLVSLFAPSHRCKVAWHWHLCSYVQPKPRLDLK